MYITLPSLMQLLLIEFSDDLIVLTQSLAAEITDRLNCDHGKRGSPRKAPLNWINGKRIMCKREPKQSKFCVGGFY